MAQAQPAGKSFDAEKAYVAQEPKGEVFFDDGREIALLHFIYSHPKLHEIRGSPQKVLDAIDEYGRTKKYLMNVGHHKGGVVTELIAKNKPKIVVELGGYVGYSAVLFGEAVRQAGGQRYYSLERSPEFAAVIMSLVDLAGLSDVVKIVVGSSAESIARLHTTKVIQHIDLLFLDHYKPAYTPDLKLCETLGLITPGTILAADNVISPGNPPYLEYVNSSVAEKRAKVGQTAKGDDRVAEFHERWAQQYQHWEKSGTLEMEIPGNPNLVYKSEMIKGFEPTGEPDAIEITHCLSIAS